MEKFNKTITTLKLTPSSPVCNPRYFFTVRQSIQIFGYLYNHNGNNLLIN